MADNTTKLNAALRRFARFAAATCSSALPNVVAYGNELGSAPALAEPSHFDAFVCGPREGDKATESLTS